MSSWQSYIFDALDIGACKNTIIVDHIGLLKEAAFKSFLSEKQIRFSITNDIQKVLEDVKTKQIIVVLPDLDLPAYLKHKATVVHFDIQKLPISIEPDVLPLLSLPELAMLIEYMNNAEILQLVDRSNYRQYADEARRYFLRNELGKIRKELLEKSHSILGYSEILELGKLWGKYVYLCNKVKEIPENEIITAIDSSSEQKILGGIIHNAFYEPLKTVDKIVPYIKNQNPARFALICFDAMGIAEWYLLKDYLSDCDFHFFENALFALIPTMTLISRSAIFYGNAETVYDLRYSNEDKAFFQKFSNYTSSSFREGDLMQRDQLLGIEAVKIIYNVFDELGHKTILPPGEKSKNVFFTNVKIYLERSTIKDDLKMLLDEGFRVWLCSDHGTVVATGNGQKIDKYLIETSCKRATIIEKSDLAKFYDVNQYEIPFVKNKIVLLAKDRTSFSYKNKVEVTHGGITLDELVVPFVEVRK